MRGVLLNCWLNGIWTEVEKLSACLPGWNVTLTCRKQFLQKRPHNRGSWTCQVKREPYYLISTWLLVKRRKPENPHKEVNVEACWGYMESGCTLTLAGGAGRCPGTWFILQFVRSSWVAFRAGQEVCAQGGGFQMNFQKRQQGNHRCREDLYWASHFQSSAGAQIN